ncbi:MAG: type III pantothenate kinase [Terrimicrobiaceae bacterium]
MRRRFLLIDVSNTFTKVALATDRGVGRVEKIPTCEVTSAQVLDVAAGKRLDLVILCSVVPTVTRRLMKGIPGRVLLVGAEQCGGLAVDYPSPNSIGADRLANALACVELYGAPSIVVDFGTAVTFDVISAEGAYVGGVIAPGLNLMAEYLHSRTALLPLLKLRRPMGVVGKSTEEAMLSGAVHGYRGLVTGILDRITEECFGGKRPVVVATGGDAGLIGESLPIFDGIDPTLTLRGLHLVAMRSEKAGEVQNTP